LEIFVGLSDYIDLFEMVGVSCRSGLQVVGLQVEFDAYEQNSMKKNGSTRS
jgi:hypothetical protein